MTELSDFYKRYGESLASRLEAIAHDPDAHPAFCFVEAAGDPSEVISFVGKSSNSPFLVWEDFEEDLETAGLDNYHSMIQGSLAILLKGLDKDAKREAYQIGRAIALKALAMMIDDSLEGELEAESIKIDVREFPCEKIGPVATSWYGYGISFKWRVPLELSV